MSESDVLQPYMRVELAYCTTNIAATITVANVRVPNQDSAFAPPIILEAGNETAWQRFLAAFADTHVAVELKRLLEQAQAAWSNHDEYIDPDPTTTADVEHGFVLGPHAEVCLRDYLTANARKVKLTMNV